MLDVAVAGAGVAVVGIHHPALVLGPGGLGPLVDIQVDVAGLAGGDADEIEVGAGKGEGGGGPLAAVFGVVAVLHVHPVGFAVGVGGAVHVGVVVAVYVVGAQGGKGLVHAGAVLALVHAVVGAFCHLPMVAGRILKHDEIVLVIHDGGGHHGDGGVQVPDLAVHVQREGHADRVLFAHGHVGGGVGQPAVRVGDRAVGIYGGGAVEARGQGIGGGKGRRAGRGDSHKGGIHAQNAVEILRYADLYRQAVVDDHRLVAQFGNVGGGDAVGGAAGGNLHLLVQVEVGAP